MTQFLPNNQHTSEDKKKKGILRRDKQNLTHSNLHMKNSQYQPAQMGSIENVDRKKDAKKSQHSLMS